LLPVVPQSSALAGPACLSDFTVFGFGACLENRAGSRRFTGRAEQAPVCVDGQPFLGADIGDRYWKGGRPVASLGEIQPPDGEQLPNGDSGQLVLVHQRVGDQVNLRTARAVRRRPASQAGWRSDRLVSRGRCRRSVSPHLDGRRAPHRRSRGWRRGVAGALNQLDGVQNAEHGIEVRSPNLIRPLARVCSSYINSLDLWTSATGPVWAKLV